jgi:hypothetical protein
MRRLLSNPSLIIDPERGNKLAGHLYRCFSSSGILGRTEMPEDILPDKIVKGSLEHLLFITQTVAIDYQRDANQLWAASRNTYQDTSTRYLYDPASLHEAPPGKIISDMQKHSLSKKAKKDAFIWRTAGITFYKKWQGSPINFLESCGWDSLMILQRLRDDTHLYNGKLLPDYPYLRGPKIGPLWLRMLRDNVGIAKLKNLDRIPIPVDIHVARASLTTGVVRGNYRGRLEDIFEYIREAWFESTKDLSVRDRDMIALDVDEPLWHLSKYGCTKRDVLTGKCPVFSVCEAQDFCTNGKVHIHNGQIELET